MNLFISNAIENPVYYFSVIFVVTLSVVLHELGHGFAAIYEGDETPREMGHMDFNPLTHMGKNSLFFLFLVGIAWGAMPVDRRRFRHGAKGDALVSFAGPLVNLILSVIFALLFSLWYTYSPSFGVGETMGENMSTLLQIGSVYNVVLFLFNMVPIPPLDGFSVLSSLSRTFRRSSAFIERNGMMLFLVLFFVGGQYMFAAGYWAFNLLAGAMLSLMG